jgi:hypothetical protein
MASGEQCPVARNERRASGSWEVAAAGCARLLDGPFHLQQQRLELFGPGLCYFRPSSPGFPQRSRVLGS